MRLLTMVATFVALLAAGAAAEDRLAVSAGMPCNTSRVNLTGAGARSGCGPGGGFRYLHEGAGLFDVGVDLSYLSFGRSGIFDGKGGRVGLAQFLINLEPRQDSVRPYLQIGAGLHHASHHSTEHPIDLAASGTLGVDVVGDRIFGAVEVRGTYLALDTSRYSIARAIVVMPNILVGVRFK